MKIGVFVGDPDAGSDLGSLDRAVRAAVEAEQAGFDSAWYPQIFRIDALTAIALAAKETERIELGTCVVPVYTRHPHALAQQAVTVQAAAGGRFVLGIGLSHQPVVEGMWGLSYDKPARHMREYLSVLRPLVTEGRVAFSGEVFRVNAVLQVDGATPFSIVIAALAPAMLRIAGELADGTVTWMTGPKTVETHIVPSITAGAKAAGRPQPRVCVALPIAVTDDAAGARARAGQIFQMYGHLPNYRRVLDMEGAAGPADVAVVGNEAEVERQLRALAAAGATDLVAVEFPGDDKGSMPRTRELLKGLVGKV
ncbi:MAG: TIGR03564 family F420-dependent LLM class oxidoreductase [Chloroflexi bacterium]|nr:TIGR03564 family F420-dependent LLM class oxidoreductase [Chloroflexota bacterium]